MHLHHGANGYQYDQAGNLTAEGAPALGTISSLYDLANNLSAETLTPPSKSTLPMISGVQMGPCGATSYQLGKGLDQVQQYAVTGQMDRGLGHRTEKIPASGDSTWYVYDTFGRQLAAIEAKTNSDHSDKVSQKSHFDLITVIDGLLMLLDAA